MERGRAGCDFCGLLMLTDVFISAADEKNEEEEAPAEKDDDKEVAADEVS